MAEIDLLTLKFHGMIHIVQFEASPVAFAKRFICLLLHLHFSPKRNNFEHFHFQIGIDYCCLCFAHHVLVMMFEFEFSFDTSATSEREHSPSGGNPLSGQWHQKFCSWNGGSWYEREIETTTSSLLIEVSSASNKEHPSSKKWSCLIFSLHKISKIINNSAKILNVFQEFDA